LINSNEVTHFALSLLYLLFAHFVERRKSSKFITYNNQEIPELSLLSKLTASSHVNLIEMHMHKFPGFSTFGNQNKNLFINFN